MPPLPDAAGLVPILPDEPAANRRAGIDDVARAAGVSRQTVSRVLNGSPHVHEGTRRRVHAVMAELRYRPNRAARTLASGRSRVFGVVATRTTMFGAAALLAAFEQAAGAAGYGVHVTGVPAAGGSSVRQAVDRLLDHGVAGLALLTPADPADDVLGDVRPDLPVVSLGGGTGGGVDGIGHDQRTGAREAVGHLLDLGHRTVWHVAGPEHWFDSRARAEGWRDGLVHAGAAVPPLLRAADWSAAAGHAAGRLLAHRREVTAVFAADDHLALGVVRALQEAGVDVPGRTSVVGFDEVPEAAYFTPPLTTVRRDLRGVAEDALASLLRRLGPEQPLRPPAARPPRLVVRDSTGPAVG